MTAMRHLQTPHAAGPADELWSDEPLSHVWHQPDGYHWLDGQGQSHGPFGMLEEALADMAAVTASQPSAGEPGGVL